MEWCQFSRRNYEKVVSFPKKNIGGCLNYVPLYAYHKNKIIFCVKKNKNFCLTINILSTFAQLSDMVSYLGCLTLGSSLTTYACLWVCEGH